MLRCKLSDALVDMGRKTDDEGKHIETDRYQRQVGKVIYLSHTRPDITLVVSLVSQQMHSPKGSHQETVYKVLMYLKGSSGKGLFFIKGERKEVEVFTDADWARSIDDRSVPLYGKFW